MRVWKVLAKDLAEDDAAQLPVGSMEQARLCSCANVADACHHCPERMPLWCQGHTAGYRHRKETCSWGDRRAGRECGKVTGV